MSAVRRAVDHTMIAVTSVGARSLEGVPRGADLVVLAGTDLGGTA